MIFIGQFAKIVEYKNNIIFKLITNENLLKALVINEENYLEQNLPENFQPTSLIYSQIFPYQYTIDIEELPKTYITMSFGNYKYINNCFKNGILTFFIFSHKTLISKSNYGLRTDYILDQVDSMFNKKKDVGDFSLELYGGGDIKVNDDYFGSMISYRFIDFSNRL